MFLEGFRKKGDAGVFYFFLTQKFQGLLDLRIFSFPFFPCQFPVNLLPFFLFKK